MTMIKDTNKCKKDNKSSVVEEAVQMFFVTQCLSCKTQHQLIQNFIVIDRLSEAFMSLCCPSIVQNLIVRKH